MFPINLLQSFIDSGDYDDPDDYPDLPERLEAYKSELAIVVCAN